MRLLFPSFIRYSGQLTIGHQEVLPPEAEENDSAADDGQRNTFVVGAGPSQCHNAGTVSPQLDGAGPVGGHERPVMASQHANDPAPVDHGRRRGPIVQGANLNAPRRVAHDEPTVGEKGLAGWVRHSAEVIEGLDTGARLQSQTSTIAGVDMDIATVEGESTVILLQPCPEVFSTECLVNFAT